MLLVFISFMPLAHPDVSKRLRVAIERPPKTGVHVSERGQYRGPVVEETKRRRS